MMTRQSKPVRRRFENEPVKAETKEGSRDRISELEGRLAALELVLSLVLGAAGRSNYSSAWTPLSDVLLQQAIRELRETLLGGASIEARATLHQLFERSINGFQIENLWPDHPDRDRVERSDRQ